MELRKKFISNMVELALAYNLEYVTKDIIVLKHIHSFADIAVFDTEKEFIEAEKEAIKIIQENFISSDVAYNLEPDNVVTNSNGDMIVFANYDDKHYISNKATTDKDGIYFILDKYRNDTLTGDLRQHVLLSLATKNRFSEDPEN